MVNLRSYLRLLMIYLLCYSPYAHAKGVLLLSSDDENEIVEFAFGDIKKSLATSGHSISLEEDACLLDYWG